MRSFKFMLPATVGLLTLAVLGISGCGGSNSLGPSANALSQVRSINALEGCANSIDILQQGTTTPITPAGGLAYGVVTGSSSQPYSTIRAGNGISLGIYSTGTTTNPLATAGVDLSPHDTNSNNNTGTYTLAATGLCSGGSGNLTPQLIRLIDAFPAFSAAAPTNTVALRLVNLSPDAGNISLFSNGTPLGGGDTAGVLNVPYAAGSGFTGSHYDTNIALNPPLNLSIRNTANSVLPTLHDTSAVTLQSNHAYTIFVIGEVNPVNGGQPLDVRIMQDI